MKRRIMAVATLAAFVGLSAAPAGAAVAAVGWWTRNPTASAPEGGMQVAKGLDGTISFGAIRAVEDAEDIEKATLTLQESGQALNGSGASLQACPAAGTWEAGKGEFADAPLADCKAGSVALQRDPQGQWTADVTSVLTGTSPALAVVPGEGATVFQVSFEAPKLDVTLRTTSGSGSGSTSSSEFDFSEFSGSGTTTSSGSSGSGGTGSGGSSDFDSGSTFDSSSSGSFSSPSSGFSGSATTFAPSVEPSAASQEAAAAATDGSGTEAAGDAGEPTGSRFTARPAAAPPLEVGGNRWAQFGLFVAIAAVIGTAAGFGRNRLTARSS